MKPPIQNNQPKYNNLHKEYERELRELAKYNEEYDNENEEDDEEYNENDDDDQEENAERSAAIVYNEVVSSNGFGPLPQLKKKSEKKMFNDSQIIIYHPDTNAIIFAINKDGSVFIDEKHKDEVGYRIIADYLQVYAEGEKLNKIILQNMFTKMFVLLQDLLNNMKNLSAKEKIKLDYYNIIEKFKNIKALIKSE